MTGLCVYLQKKCLHFTAISTTDMKQTEMNLNNGTLWDVFVCVFTLLCMCVCVFVCLPGSRQPAACQWEVVYPAQTLAVYTTLFITGRVLLNYHLIYELAWCVYMCMLQMSGC